MLFPDSSDTGLLVKTFECAWIKKNQLDRTVNFQFFSSCALAVRYHVTVLITM